MCFVFFLAYSTYVLDYQDYVILCVLSTQYQTIQKMYYQTFYEYHEYREYRDIATPIIWLLIFFCPLGGSKRRPKLDQIIIFKVDTVKLKCSLHHK